MKVRSGLFFGMVLLVTAAHADPRMWGEDGIPIRQGMHLKWDRGMARDASGNTLLVWTEKSTGQRDVRAQLVNPAGVEQWMAGGVNVTPEYHYQDSPVGVSVDGGWIIAWADFRGNPDCVNNPYHSYYSCAEIYAQKLDYSGNRTWPDNEFTGVAVLTDVSGIDQFSLQIAPDGEGGAIIAWDNYWRIEAQRVAGNGDLLWPQAVQVVDSVNLWDLRVAPGGDGSIYVAWQQWSDIYLSRLLTDGSLPWGPNGMPVLVGSSGYQQMSFVFDGAEGCYAAWQDERSGSSQVYAQHMASDGEPMWAVNGIPLSTAGGSSPDIALSSNGGETDGMVALWPLGLPQNQFAVYAQKVSPEGTVAWQAGGIVLAGSESGWWPFTSVTTDHNGGLVGVWPRWQSGWPNPRLYAARLSSSGAFAWGTNPVPVGEGSSHWPYYYWTPLAIVGDFGTYLVAFLGGDSLGLESIHYQLLDHADGERLLGANGVSAVSGIGGDAHSAHVALMGNQRTAVIWNDGRTGSDSWNGTLYYQILGADGQFERPVNGERLVPNTTGHPYVYQRGVQTCDDGEGGLFVSYLDMRTGTQLIRVSHISLEGTNVGPDSGMVAWWHEGMRDQENGFVCPDGEGGCYVGWSQYAENYWTDAYVMRLNHDLQRVWSQPVRLTQTIVDDYLHGLVSGADNCCIAVWQSGELGDYNISAAGICADGTVAWNDTLCGAPGDQDSPVVVGDGADGAYIVWHDSRVEANDGDIYAQRVAADGTTYWAAGGIPVYAGADAQWNPQVVLDSGDKLGVTWFDFQNLSTVQIYAQRMSLQGTPLWENSGVPVSRAYSYSSPQLVASSRAGILPVWEDYRAGTSSLFATHLDSTGALFDDPYWLPDSGGVVADPSYEHEYFNYPVAASDGWGGCVVGWTKYESEYYFEGDVTGGVVYTADVYAQRLFDYATSAREQPRLLPHEFALYQNFPNPFNPATEIRFDLPQTQRVKLTVFDLLGREVRVVVDEPMAAGKHHVNFDAASMPSGLYVYRIEAGDFREAKKMVVLK